MSDQPGWLKVALGAGVGFLCGVLLIVVLAVTSGDGSAPERQRTATVAGVEVPQVVGLRLDVARERLEGEGFVVEHDGGGLLGVVVASNWEVRSQDPAAGERRAAGATVTVYVERP